MRVVAPVLLAAVAGCSFTHGALPTDDAMSTDAPPTSTSVRFISLSANFATVRPGAYGIAVTAVLRNDLDVEITDVAASLSFEIGSGDRSADYRFRDVDRREGVTEPQPDTLPSSSDATYRFIVDVLPWAVASGPISINGKATFIADALALSASPLMVPLALPFESINPPIVVNFATDERDGDNDICFREAVERAIAVPGLDRITFDPVRFPPDSMTATLLSSALGEIATLTGATGDLIIDGTGAGVVLDINSAWETQPGRYGLRVTGGSLVVADVTFRDFGFNYPAENVSSNNCGTGVQRDGGAIRIDGGTLVLEGNRFRDPNVGERNCYAASIRIEGGSGHRIHNNLWTDQTMDSLFIDAATIEISDNVMNAGTSPNKVDDGIYINTQGGSDLWVVGNVIVDHEYSGVTARGIDAGVLYVVNNTFVRNGTIALSAFRREQGARTIVLRDNVYIGNNPAAIQVDNNGVGFDLAYETVVGSPLCNGSCPNAVIDIASMSNPASAGVMNAAGATRAAFTPVAGSLLIDSANGWLDRNGGTPRHFTGSGQERGAVELP